MKKRILLFALCVIFIYPLYYTKEVVDFFGKLHSIDNLKVDIEAGRIYEIMEKEMPDRNKEI